MTRTTRYCSRCGTVLEVVGDGIAPRPQAQCRDRKCQIAKARVLERVASAADEHRAPMDLYEVSPAALALLKEQDERRWKIAMRLIETKERHGCLTKLIAD